MFHGYTVLKPEDTLIKRFVIIRYTHILGDSPTSHSRSYQLPMVMPCRQQAAPGGQNVIGYLLAL